MTRVKQQVVEMLQDIPDDKVIHILEMMRGLMLLYSISSESAVAESESSAMGIFKKHANPNLIPKEKDAWGEAVREKYANY